MADEGGEMTDKNDEDFVNALKSLPGELLPPPQLERIVLQSLRDKGLVRQKPGTSILKFAAVAACCVFFFLGGVLFNKERTASSSVSMSENTFAFFLMEDENYQSPKSDHELQQRIELYRNWGVQLRQKGVILSGTKLQDERHILNNTGEESRLQNEAIAGYFLIDTKDMNQALEIARTCPHLRFGGRIEVRQVHPV
jgi:hypothetical protein